MYKKKKLITYYRNTFLSASKYKKYLNKAPVEGGISKGTFIRFLFKGFLKRTLDNFLTHPYQSQRKFRSGRISRLSTLLMHRLL